MITTHGAKNRFFLPMLGKIKMYFIIYERMILQDSLVFDHVVRGFYTFD
jgi:hypothetical protein